MSFVPIRGYFPQYPISMTAATGTIDATGERYAWIGNVMWADASVATRDIRRARWRFSNVTKAGGSALTFSLQNLDTANGSPHRPDGTPDQTVAIANADAGFISNSNYTTANLSADRTVSRGERIAGVLEFDGSGRLGSDSVAIIHTSYGGTTGERGDGPALLTASWATQGAYNNLSFEFADGTEGILAPYMPISATATSLALNTGTTPDEVALVFTPNFKCKIDGLWAGLAAGVTADFELVLYQGTTALQTAAFDAHTLRMTTFHIIEGTIPETELTPGTTYYIAVKPTTANSVTLSYGDAVSNAVLLAMLGNTDTAYYSTRADAGSWAVTTTTRRPIIGVRFSAIDDGAGGGSGGLLRHPGMSGGIL